MLLFKESQVSILQRLEDNGATVVHSTIELVNVSWNYAGSYQCVAENFYGVVYSAKANVTVHSKCLIDKMLILS